MSITYLDDRLQFPHPSLADEDGLLAIGGDLSTERLLLAYRSGIFPWFSGEIPRWYCPDPRFVLFPDELYVSKSMKILLRRDAFRVCSNQAFEEVIRNCSTVYREGQWGTWITQDMIRAYTRLNALGHAVSYEAWLDDELVGGLYGIRMGRMFFGESMFCHVSNASKYAFISCARQLAQEGVALIDCQVYTEHLESLGARHIPRQEFLSKVAEYIQ